jgi:hypothetical protein
LRRDCDKKESEATSECRESSIHSARIRMYEGGVSGS